MDKFDSEIAKSSLQITQTIVKSLWAEYIKVNKGAGHDVKFYSFLTANIADRLTKHNKILMP